MDNKISKIILIGFMLIVFFLMDFKIIESFSDTLSDKSDKKIITEVSRQEALKKFGFPHKLSSDLWYYDHPESFYVYFPEVSSAFKFFVFPYVVRVNSPFEMKAFILHKDSRVVELTSKVKWNIADETILQRKGNLFIPLKEGKTEVFAEYRGAKSVPCVIYVKSEVKKKKAQELQLLAIDILPYNPEVFKRHKIEFTALGVYLKADSKRIFVKRISSEVEWFVSRKGETIKSNSNVISFPDVGSAEVFCEYEGVRSTPQEVTVNVDLSKTPRKIKRVDVIPSFIVIPTEYTLEMRGFVTYFDNRTYDRTPQIDWQVSDKSIAVFKNKGVLKLVSEGIITIDASLDNFKSLPAKILVKNEIPELVEEKSLDSEYESMPVEKLLEDTNSIAKKLSSPKVKIKSLKIDPVFTEISLGETINFKATAIVANGLQIDVTSLVKWESSDTQKAVIKKGKLSTSSEGKVLVHAYLEGVRSNPARVIIEEPKLISIALDPQEKNSYVNEEISVKATGHYTNGTKKDITSIVNWFIFNKKIIEEVSEGVFKTKRIGKTDIYCQLGKVESLPLKISVFLPPLKTSGIFIFSFLILIAFIFILLRLTIKLKIKKLKKLAIDNPSGFIIRLYSNVKKILSVFGLPYKPTIPPLEYAIMINNNFSLKENSFFNLSSKFSEAEYSSHKITSDDALSFLNDYNAGMMNLKSNVSKFFIKFLILLYLRLPFLI